MKKILFMAITIIMIFMSFVLCRAEERTWEFSDSAFSMLIEGGSDVLSEEKELNNLYFGPNVKYSLSGPKLNGIQFKGSVYLGNEGSKNSGYLKFYLNGSTDIHMLASCHSTDARSITLCSPDNKTQKLMIGELDDYVFKYRGSAGYAYLYSEELNVRLIRLSLKDYSESEYAAMQSGTKKVWDFVDYSDYGTLKSSVNINGLEIIANSTYSVTFKKEIANGAYGDTKAGYVDFDGDGRYNGRYMTFPVPRNSDIYLDARASDDVSENRKLLVRNKYYGTPSTDMEDIFLPVSGTLSTYKISYYGEGEDIAISSYTDGIRIYRITIVPRVDTVTTEKVWNVSTNQMFTVGAKNGVTIDGLSLKNASVSSCSEGGYTKRISIKSDRYASAGVLSFAISDSSYGRGSRVKRQIGITARAEMEGCKLVLVNDEDYIIGTADLSTAIKQYTFDYTGCYDRIHIYTFYPANGRKVYTHIYILNNGIPIAAAPDDTQRTVSVTKGQKYQYFFESNNINPSGFTYNITYDPNMLSTSYIGYGDGDSYSRAGINIINNVSGKIEYTIDNTYTKWSGTTTSVIFTARSTGSTMLSFTAEPK